MRFTLALPLIVTVAQSLPLLDVKTSVTPVPFTIAPPLTVKPPPSMMYSPGFNVRTALALTPMPPQ